MFSGAYAAFSYGVRYTLGPTGAWCLLALISVNPEASAPFVIPGYANGVRLFHSTFSISVKKCVYLFFTLIFFHTIFFFHPRICFHPKNIKITRKYYFNPRILFSPQKKFTQKYHFQPNIFHIFFKFFHPNYFVHLNYFLVALRSDSLSGKVWTFWAEEDRALYVPQLIHHREPTQTTTPMGIPLPQTTLQEWLICRLGGNPHER